MFREAIIHLATRLSAHIDDMLLGDFDYIAYGDRVYADVDYRRLRRHHPTPLSWTPAAGRGFGPQRPLVAGPVSRRPGSVPERPVTCVSSVRTAGSQPATVTGRSRTTH